MLIKKSLMPKFLVFLLTVLLALLLFGQLSYADSAVTVNYGDITLNAPWQATHWSDVWDLTQGDLTLSYTIDMKGLNQPGTWNNKMQ